MRCPVRVAAFLFLWLAASAGAGAVELSGHVRDIIDGDDIRVCADNECTRIRFCGIDVPEIGCPGYARARATLRALVEGRYLRCVQVGSGTVCDGRSKPTHGDRLIAQCFLEGADVADTLVKSGSACDWTRYSGGHYSRNGNGRECPKNHRRTCAWMAPNAQRD